MVNLEEAAVIVYLIKNLFIAICTHFTLLKIINDKRYFSIDKILGYVGITILILLVEIIYSKTNSSISTVMLILGLSFIFIRYTHSGIGYTLLLTIISLAVNYAIYFVSVILSFAINKIVGIIQNDFINIIIIMFIHIIILFSIFKIRKIKNGVITLQKNLSNIYIEIIILNISICILFIGVIFSNRETIVIRNTMYIFLVFVITLFITMQKSFKLYYKQKLLQKDLDETKEELAKKEKEVEDLEAENIAISKKSHTLAHKQRSLEYKLEQMAANTEMSTEEAAEVRERLQEIKKDLYKEKTTVKLYKTEIPQIDDVLEYMQSECKKNKIDFELQIKGNIHYMTNNLIPKEDLETLLADHIKNAIIAVNHTDNVNRSILVRLGEIDGIYSLYIYDSGIEFEKETLENLGKKPSTTHQDEGGTGMGFMNTFDTLKRCNASLTIEEIGAPSKDNYTKAIIIKFEKNHEFKVTSYR